MTMIGYAYEKSGKPDVAVKYYGKALKLKPNDAAPVNPPPGGSCPPPRPVHAVSTTARMQATASTIDRRM